MTKKNLLFLTLLCIMLLLASCQGENSTASLRVILDSSTNTRVIVPEDYPLEVVKYQISGTGPGGASFSLTTERTSATLEGLPIGEWELHATGLNENNDMIVEGTTTFTLSQNNTSATIKLNSLIGEGNLHVTVTWDANKVEDPEFEVELTKQGESVSEKSDIEIGYSSASAEYSRMNLESGSYILQGRLYSQGELVAGFTEAVRIVDQMTSEKEIELILSEFPSSPGTLQLLNDSGVPVLCSITGLDENVEAGKSITVNLEPNNSTLRNYTVTWYLDGNYLAEGKTISFKVEHGQHRIDAVAYTDKIGSYGSTGITFESFDNTAIGVPGNSVNVSDEKGLSLGHGSMVHFLPDGKFLLINGQDQSLQLCELTTNSVRVIESFGSYQIEGVANTPVTAVSRIMDDSGNVAILLGTNDNPDTIHLNYNTSTGEITEIQNTGDMKDSLSLGTFTRVLPFSFYDSLTERYVILASDSENRVITLERVIENLSPDPEFFPYSGYDYTRAAINYSSTFYGPAAITISPDEESYIIITTSGEMFRFGRTSHFPDKSKQYQIKNLTNSSYENASDMVSYDNVVIIGGNGYIGSHDPYDDVKKNYIALDYDVLDLAANEENGFVYALGNDLALHLFSVSDAGNLTESSEITLSGEYDRMELSPDGSRLIIYNCTTGGNSIEIFRINTRNAE